MKIIYVIIFLFSFIALNANDMEISINGVNGKWESDKIWRDATNELTIYKKTTKHLNFTIETLSFEVKPQSLKRFLLTVSAKTKIEFKANKFFDGFETHKLKDKKIIERKTIFQTFPLASVWNNQKGVMLGITPSSLTSNLNFMSNTKSLWVKTQVVVDAQKKQKMQFIFGNFHPEFEWRNAIDCYYKAFPKYFNIANGVDERIYGIGGYLTSLHINRDLEIHAARQLHHTWEWTYVPWNRAGEWYVDAKDWRKGDGYLWLSAYLSPVPCTYKQYHAMEKHRYNSGNRQAAMMYYILVKDIWSELLDKYPDARSVDSHGVSNKYSSLYSRNDNRNKTSYAFAYGSKLSNYLENELRKVAQNYEISGFAFDMTNSSHREYNDAQLKMAEGRGFDKNGKVYTCDTILPVHFSRYIHTLFKGKKRLAVYVNQALEDQTVWPVFYGDGVMFEGGPERLIAHVQSMRLMAGAKPMTFWGGIDLNRCKAINSRLIQCPDEMQIAHKGLAQYQLFQCLRYGASMMNWAIEGNRELFEPWLELILEIKRLGWQVIPAISGDNRLWMSRFGNGEKTVFIISNPLDKSIKTKIKLHKSYLGKFQPKSITSHKIKFLEDEKYWYFDLKLAPKQIVVIRDINWYKPETKILGDKLDIISYFSENEAKNGSVNIVCSKNRQSLIIKEYIDRYWPYIRAGIEKNKSIYSREVFKLNPAYRDCWRLPLAKTFSQGKCFAIGTIDEMPDLKNKLSQSELDEIKNNTNGFIKVLPKILWIGGSDAKALRKAAETYFYMMDKFVENDLNSKNYKKEGLVK